MRTPRTLLTTLSAAALLAAGLAATTAPATAAPADIKINEVESNGDTVGDFTELLNTGTAPVDISGWRFRDNDTSHAFYVVPDGTVVAAGDYYVITEAQQNFGLGAPDSVTLYLPDATTIVDTYAWTAHASVTYGRCPGSATLTDTAASTRGAANSCPPPLRINEIESDDGTPGDWIELLNVTTATLDVSGWVLRDSGDANAYSFPSGTTIPAGGYRVVDQASTGFAFGLGAGDSVRLSLPGATTLLDSYSWTAHAATTYGRCAPNGTGAFTTTASPTKGGSNACPGDLTTGAWPGGSSVATVDSPAFTNLITSNLSGLTYQPATKSLWAVRNGAGTLYQLEKQGTTWGPAAGDWAAGKTLRYGDGTGDPDAEGVTFTDAGPAGGAYVATERNNAVSGTSRPAILRFDPSTPGTSLNATRDYNLTADLPGLGANLGLEGIAWVPDTSLVASGFKDQRTGAAYTPTSYPNHGTGLFFVGVEQNGMIYAYALDEGTSSYTRVASFASGFPSVMELTWEADTQRLWVVCDDTCQGRSSRFAVNGSGFFAPTPYVDRPSGMANLNNEGFAVTPDTECVNGLKPVWWADDGDTGGSSLREGTLSCTTTPGTSPGSTSGTTPAATPPASSLADRTDPRVRIKGVRDGGRYPRKAPKPRCVATDDRGVVACRLRTDRLRVDRTRVVVTVTARATDAAGNTTTARKSYLRRR